MVKNIVITAGGTSERIDDVRVISNFSSGRLGLAVAKAFSESDTVDIGAIYYLCDKNTVVPENDKVKVIRVAGAQGLLNGLQDLFQQEKIDAVVHAMAVSDYTVKQVSTLEAVRNREENKPENILNQGKISSEMDDLVILLKKTPKVIGEIKKIQPDTILVGFKLLTDVSREHLIQIGYRLLQKNDCDFVLANDLTEITGDRHRGHLIAKDGSYQTYETKQEIASAIVNHVSKVFQDKEAES